MFQITSAADSEAVTRQKLVKGHAYSVTGAEEVKHWGVPWVGSLVSTDPGWCSQGPVFELGRCVLPPGGHGGTLQALGRSSSGEWISRISIAGLLGDPEGLATSSHKGLLLEFTCHSVTHQGGPGMLTLGLYQPWNGNSNSIPQPQVLSKLLVLLLWTLPGQVHS